jgi:hypothetical protein
MFRLSSLNIKRIWILRLAVLLFLLIGIFTLYKNNGFYYSEFKNQTIVELEGPAESMKNVLDAFAIVNGVSRVDRLNNNIYFQETTIEEVNSRISSLVSAESGISFSISEVYSLNQSDHNSIAYFVLIIIISTLLVLVYFLLKKNSDLKWSLIIRVLSIYLLVTLLSAISLLGIQSILSGYYQIRQYDLYIVVLLILMSSIIFYKSALIFGKEENRVSMNLLFDSLSSISLNFIRIFAVFILVVSISLGTNFVVHGFFIILSLLIPVFYYKFLHRLINFKIRFRRTIKVDSTKRVAKSDKKQKKSKKKAR